MALSARARGATTPRCRRAAVASSAAGCRWAAPGRLCWIAWCWRWCCRRTSACCCCRWPRCEPPLPDAYTLAHYATVFQDSSGMIRNTPRLLRPGRGLDVVLGVTIAYLILRTTLPAGAGWMPSPPRSLAVPGIVLAIGYLCCSRERHACWHRDAAHRHLGDDHAGSMRCAACPCAALVRGGAAAGARVAGRGGESLGATPLRTIRRVVVPLMAGGILAGLSPASSPAAVELSATILLTSAESQAPMSYGIYLYMQSVAGRGPGAGAGRWPSWWWLGTYAVAPVVVERTVGQRRSSPPAPAAQAGRPTMKKVSVQCRHVRLSYGDRGAARWISRCSRASSRAAGPVGPGKSIAAAAIAGFQPAPERRTADRRRRCLGPAAVAAQRGHGVPEPCAVASPRRVGQRRLLARSSARSPRPNAAPGAAPRSSWWAGRQAERRPTSCRRPAAAGGLARTIVIEPQVLLLDEPLSNLDKTLRVQMRQELLAMQRRLGLTTIFVTHDQEEAMTTADRMVVLDGGVLQQVGAAALYDEPANAFVAHFVGTMNLLPFAQVSALAGQQRAGRAGLGPVILPTSSAPGRSHGAGTAPLSARPHRWVTAGRRRARARPAGLVRCAHRVGRVPGRVHLLPRQCRHAPAVGRPASHRIGATLLAPGSGRGLG